MLLKDFLPKLPNGAKPNSMAAAHSTCAKSAFIDLLKAHWPGQHTLAAIAQHSACITRL
jgi:hypothetical protein